MKNEPWRGDDFLRCKHLEGVIARQKARLRELEAKQVLAKELSILARRTVSNEPGALPEGELRGGGGVRPDERQLLCAVAAEDGQAPMHYARRLGIHPKRAQYLYLKWTRKGWFDYGVSARTGWITPEGAVKARELAQRPTGC